MARNAKRKGDFGRAGRLARQAYRFSPQCPASFRRLAKFFTFEIDPNKADADEHWGVDALLSDADEEVLGRLSEKYQKLIAFSLIRRRKPVPEPLRHAIAGRYDDDSVILKQLFSDPDGHVHGLIKALCEHNGFPAPPFIRGRAGVDAVGFPSCQPSHGDKVTVAMTAFNVEETIEQAIRSVTNQTWRNLELFIVDDASTDRTGAIIEEYAAIDDRIVALHNSANFGTYCSKNRALERATGRWFTCHDADDWSHPLKIERQVEALIRKNTVSNTSRWIRSGTESPVYMYRFDGYSFAHRNYSSLLFHTDTVRDAIGYYDSVRVSADSEFLARLTAKFGPKELRDEHELLSIGRVRAESLTTTEGLEVGFGNMSISRRIYYENYCRWHQTSKSHYIPMNHHPRKFDVPEALIASHKRRQ